MITGITSMMTGSQHVLKAFVGDTLVYPWGDTVIHYTTSDGNIVNIPQSEWSGHVMSNTYINNDGQILFNYDVTYIPSSAFTQSETLLTIILPSGVTVIQDSAFKSCWTLSGVTFLGNVTTIGKYAFEGFRGGIISFPNSVTSIGLGAFYASKVKSFTFPNSLSHIPGLMFSETYTLTSVTIPTSVQSIGDYAFNHCSSLCDIYYLGTKDQWNLISKEESWFPSATTVGVHLTFTVHCSDGDIVYS